jgi:hypothetical protein
MIKERGGLYSLAMLRRMKIEIPAPGGNEWSHDADGRIGLDRYVHLCFRPTHPMEYVARQDGRIVDSVYLQIHPDVLKISGVMYTAGVSNKSGMRVYTLDQARDLIDFEVLYTGTDWRDPEIQLRLQNAEKCELLIPDHIPVELIRNFPNG